MLIQIKTPVALKIERPEDLPKLKEFMEENKIKVNKSEIARQLKLDRRTVSKYLEGFEKRKTRNKPSKMDEQYERIKELLSSETQRFSFRIDLYRYMQENHGLDIARSTFSITYSTRRSLHSISGKEKWHSRHRIR